MPKPTTTCDEAPLPLWAERDVAFKKLSPDQQHSLRQIVGPLYQQFVVEPHDPLERSCGISVIHLIWSELLKQCALASLNYSRDDYSETRRGQQFTELFQLLNAKCQLSTLLIQLRRHPLERTANPAMFPFDSALLPTPVPECNT
jgi:hypothetical protein